MNAAVDYEQVIADLTRKRDAIDAAIVSLRLAIGAPDPASMQEAVSAQAQRFGRMSTCSVCGAEFERKGGVSGRFCSRRCYAGDLSVADRRALILKTLTKRGPMFPSAIRDALDINHSTVTNDLYQMSKAGQVENGENGWQLASAEVEETAVRDDEAVAPFAQTSPSGPTSLPSRSD